MVLLLKAAFDGCMPELIGQRKYGGVYFLPDTYSYSNPSVKSALKWMASYGLWGNANFIQDDIVSEDTLNTILKRFYTYFGTNEKDDFFATTNHDFLYAGGDDSEITPETSEYMASRLLSTTDIGNNCISYGVELAQDKATYSPYYTQMVKYASGELDYSFLDDTTVTSDISAIKAIDSLTSWTSIAQKQLSTYASCSLFNYANIMQNSDEVPFAIFTTGKLEYFKQGYKYTVDQMKEKLNTYYSALGLTSEEISTYTSAYLSFQNKVSNLYSSSIYADKIFKQAFVYSSSTGTDIFADNSINIDLKGLITNSGFSTDEMAKMAVVDEASFLSYGKVLETASKAELVATTMFEYGLENGDALLYKEGDTSGREKFVQYVGNNMAYDYMQSEKYTNSLNVLLSLYTGIKNVFTERVDSSSWLSSTGKAAVKEKISKIGYAMIGKHNDGTSLNYESRKVDTSLNLRASFASYYAKTAHACLADLVSGINKDDLFLYVYGPFFGNAFYSPVKNTINITLGAVFSLGDDLSTI
jgi:hypothetical protein